MERAAITTQAVDAERRRIRGDRDLAHAARAGHHATAAARGGGLAEQQMALTERETVDSAIRQVAFLDSEIAQVERLIAADAVLAAGQAANDRPGGQPDRRG